MKKHHKIIVFLGTLLLSTGGLKAQDSLWHRFYQPVLYNQYDLRNSSSNGIVVHRLINDAFRKELMPKMGEKIGNVSYGLINFSSTFLLMIWSHEFGHSLRAKQAGGYFRIHNAALPVPYTTMHLPTDISLVDETLAVTGGFEVNYLTVRSLQREFVEQNGIYNEDLGLSFAHRLMYPLYTSLIAPIDPEDPDVWLDTPGDPANCAKLVYQNYSENRIIFPEDSAVNPEFVRYYQQSALLGAFFNLLDPQFYREIGGTFGKRSKMRKPIFIVGNHYSGWTYGTLFNVSPLGYELYMNHYLHLKGNMFTIYMKYGNPYKNLGLGLGWQNMIDVPKFEMSSNLDIWSQDIFGMGLSCEVSVDYKLAEKLDVHLDLGYKTEGYVLGKQIDPGINAGIGLRYLASYKKSR